MIHWIFIAATCVAAVVAAFAKSFRLVILALWAAGLGAGGLYLTLGAELLAIVQWIVSTLIALSFVFFAVMFGEYSRPKGAPVLRGGLFMAAGGLLTIAVPCALWLGGSAVPEELLTLPTAGNDLASLGASLVQEHFIALEILALTLFITLVGGGVIARPDSRKKGDLA